MNEFNPIDQHLADGSASVEPFEAVEAAGTSAAAEMSGATEMAGATNLSGGAGEAAAKAAYAAPYQAAQGAQATAMPVQGDWAASSSPYSASPYASMPSPAPAYSQSLPYGQIPNPNTYAQNVQNATYSQAAAQMPYGQQAAAQPSAGPSPFGQAAQSGSAFGGNPPPAAQTTDAYAQATPMYAQAAPQLHQQAQAAPQLHQQGQAAPQMQQPGQAGQPMYQQGQAGQPPFAGYGMPATAAFAPSKPKTDAFAQLMQAAIAQLKALFSPDTTSVLPVTAQNNKALTWALWLGLYAFLLPLVLMLSSAIPFGLGRAPSMSLYFTAFFALLFSLAAAYGVAFLSSIINKKKVKALDVLNGLMATTLPLILFSLPIFLLALASLRLALILFLIPLFWHEILNYRFYLETLGTGSTKAGNWIVMGAFAVRIVLGLLIYQFWGAILMS